MHHFSYFAVRSPRSVARGRVAGLFRPWLVATSVVLGGLPSFLSAQTIDAVVEGVVRTEIGDPMPDVTVRFVRAGVEDSGDAPTTVTDPQGRFVLEVPSGVEGSLRLTAAGYVPVEQSISALSSAATRTVASTMAALYSLDAVSVVAPRERPLLNTENAETGGSVDAVELRALPTDARNPLALAFNVPGVSQSTGFFGDAPPLTIHGDNGLYTRYTLDGLDNNEGFLGGPRLLLPISALERLDVHASVYRPAYGRSSNGIVDLRSRAGGPEWAGEVFAVNRPGVPFDADPKFTPAGVDPDGFERFQVGGSIGGPIVSGRTFVFGALEYSNEREDRIGSTARTSFLGTEERETWKAFTRLDHGWSETQTTTLRFALGDVRRRGQGGGVIVPEADITTRRIGSLSSLTHQTAFREGRGSNRLSVQLGTFTWDFPPSVSDLETPQVTIVGQDLTTVEAVVGSSNFIFDESELQLQIKEELELRLGDDHALGAGVEVVTASFELLGANTNPQGAYTVVNEGNITASGRFLSIDDVPSDVRVLRYSIDAQPQQVDLTQTLWSAYLEDRWRVSPSLTVQAGVRWDYDDLTSRGESDADLDNFQPRLSFNWLATPETVVRGGWGLYAGTFPYAVYSDAQQFGPDGNAVVTFEEGTAFPPPVFGQGPGPQEIAQLQGALPPREVRRTFARGLEQPMASQTSVGVQREIGDSWAVSVDGVWVETRNLPRSWDLNAVAYTLQSGDTIDRTPSFGDTLRAVDPAVSGFRRLTTTDSGGKSRHLALHTQVRRAFGAGLAIEGGWTWSRTQNDTEDINFNAASANDFDAEWADGINDRRHHVTLRSVWDAFAQLRVAGIVDWQTGTPINRVANFRDLDGSGSIFGNGFIGNHDRFAGVTRNAERLPSAWTVNASVEWRPPLAGGDVSLKAEGFNLLNRTNYAGFANGIPGGGPRTQVGRPGDPIVYTTAAPPRQIQFTAGWSH